MIFKVIASDIFVLLPCAIFHFNIKETSLSVGVWEAYDTFSL